MRPYMYVGVDYNLTLCLLHSRLQYIYQGQPYARVDLSPMPESTSTSSQGLRILPQREVTVYKESMPEKVCFNF